MLTDIGGAVDAASKGYTNWTKYSSSLNSILDKSNSKYKDKLVKDWFDEYVKTNPSYQGVTNLPAKYALWDALGRTDDEFKKNLGMSKLSEYESSSNFKTFKTVASALPYVGSAIAIVDLLISGGKDAEPAKPSPPMAFDVSLKVNGTLINPVPGTAIPFLTPGSPKLGANKSLVPVYDNILGVFNILKPPPMKFAGINHFIESFHFFDLPGNRDLGGFPTSVKLDNVPDAQAESNIWNSKPIFKQYKLNEDIKYIVNPAAKVVVEMIDACIILEYNNTPGFSVTPHDFTGIQSNPSYPLYDGLFDAGMAFSTRLTNIENTGLDLEYISLDNSVVRLRTKYVPLSCLKNESFTLFNGNSQPRVFVKMLVKMKRTDVPNGEAITEVVTYDITTSFLSPTSETTACRAKFKVKQNVQVFQNTPPSFIGHHLSFEFEEFLGLTCFPYPVIEAGTQNITYTTGMPDINNLNGIVTFPDNVIVSNNTYIKAKRIILGKQLVFGTGVHLISSEPMTLDADNTGDPEVILEIQPFTNFDLWQCPTTPVADLKATDAEILAICNSQDYINKTFNKKEDASAGGQLQKEAPNVKIVAVSPNPTSGETSLHFLCASDCSISLEIFDMAGKFVSTPVRNQDLAAGNYTWNINMNEFEKGVYLFYISTNTGLSETKKVVLIR